MKKWCGIILLYGLMQAAFATPGTIQILAAENFYGDVAKTIGGTNVTVTSVISSPSSDPHFFNAPPNLEALVNNANIIIENGAGYDKWMDALYAKSNHKALLINVAEVAHTGSVFNPHIWYDPATMPLLAKDLAFHLIQLDPTNKSTYYQNVKAFLSMGHLYQAQLNQVADQVKGMSVTATEPVANALLKALQLNIINQAFQVELMNNEQLSPESIAIFEKSLTDHQVKLLIYNDQVTDVTTVQLQNIAIQAGTPIVGMYEMMPEGLHYYQWMYQNLFAIRDAFISGSAES